MPGAKAEGAPGKPPQQRWHSVASGVAAGFCTRVVVSPLDVVKIRAQLQIENPSHPDAK